jgi:integrase
VTIDSVAPPAPRRKRRRTGLGLYQDAKGCWILDTVCKGHRLRKRYGQVPAEVAKQLAKRDSLAHRVAIMTTGQPVPKEVPVTDLSIGAALRRFETDAFPTLASRTRVTYRRLMMPLRAHLGDIRVSALNPLDLERYKRIRTAQTPGRRSTDTGTVSCNRELALLSAVIERCKTWELTARADNPVAKVKRFKEPKGRDRILSFEEEDRLLAALREPFRTLTQLALETGIRLQREGIPLTRADFDLARGQLHIKARNAKNGRERWIPLTAGMVVRLRAMQAASTNQLAFPAPRGGLLNRFRTTYFETVRKLGLAGTKLGIHTLRHTWATRFYEATGDLLLLQRLGGWASLSMVQRYAHARQERAAAAIQQMVDARGSAERRESGSPQIPPRVLTAVSRNS